MLIHNQYGGRLQMVVKRSTCVNCRFSLKYEKPTGHQIDDNWQAHGNQIAGRSGTGVTFTVQF